MPGPPGGEILDQLSDRYPGIAVVIMSGFVPPRAALQQAVAVVTKPVKGVSLASLIADLMAARRS
ncbi:MAG: hypothetical protein GY724_10830 [Actinomycetia bacterium]|nr:hypothetical protein [Actinomycetes bacterium]